MRRTAARRPLFFCRSLSGLDLVGRFRIARVALSESQIKDMVMKDRYSALFSRARLIKLALVKFLMVLFFLDLNERQGRYLNPLWPSLLG